jgi:two-component system chemotaxis response regulator CheY
MPFNEGGIMRFFFDYTKTDQSSLYDYHGEEFLSASDAFGFAEATAEFLKNNLNGNWTGWTVEVRNAEGAKCFSLPVTLGLEVAANAKAESNPAAKNQGAMLIIEDGLIHSAIIDRVAAKVGFSTTKAHSYEDACKVLGERQFDCITLDLGLGEHVGMDVLRFLSTIRCRAQIIVISCSDKDLCDDVAELGKALDLNVCESVPKPIDLETLRGKLVQIVESLEQNRAAVQSDVSRSLKGTVHKDGSRH